MTRPSFDEVHVFWRAFLGERGHPTKVRYVSREQLCLEPGLTPDRGFRVAFASAGLTEGLEPARSIYARIAPTGDPLGFTLLGEYEGAAVCTLVGDDWGLDADDDHNPFERKDWGLFFDAQNTYPHFRPIADAAAWRSLKERESRQLSGLDFVLLAHPTLVRPRRWWQIR